MNKIVRIIQKNKDKIKKIKLLLNEIIMGLIPNKLMMHQLLHTFFLRCD